MKIGVPKEIRPKIPSGTCPNAIALILSNLSLEPLSVKFQQACRSAANRTARITMVCMEKAPFKIYCIKNTAH